MRGNRGRGYETEYDATVEALAGAVVSVLWECRVTLTQPGAPFDYYLYRGGRLAALGELKSHNFAYRYWPEFMVSARKWRRLEAAGRQRGVPVAVFVRFPDGGIRWIQVQPDNVTRRGSGGRYDRHDPADVEPCVFVNWEKSEELEKTLWDG